MFRSIALVFAVLLATAPIAHAGEDFSRAYKQADQLSKRGNHARAEEILSGALEKATTPEEGMQGWKLMADIYEKQDKTQQALDAYHRASEQQALMLKRQNEDLARTQQEVDEENQRIEAMAEERKALEQQLKDLEDQQ